MRKILIAGIGINIALAIWATIHFDYVAFIVAFLSGSLCFIGYRFGNR